MKPIITILVISGIFLTKNAFAAECPAGEYKPGDGWPCATCPANNYCTGNDSRNQCSEYEESAPGSTSSSDCIAISCPAGQYARGHRCNYCEEGTYKSSASTGGEMCDYPSVGYYITGCTKGNTGCTSQTQCPSTYYCTGGKRYSVSDGYQPTGCKPATTVRCSGQTECGIGYYCKNGTSKSCGANATTITSTASSADDCICVDGYTKNADGECVAEKQQTQCPYSATTLHIGDIDFPMWTECDTPALWIGLTDGNCCINLTTGFANDALNIQYNETTYHTTN